MRVFVLVTLSILFTTISSTRSHDFKTSELQMKGLLDRRRLQPELELSSFNLPSLPDNAIITIDSDSGSMKSTVHANPVAKGGPGPDPDVSSPSPHPPPPRPHGPKDASGPESDSEGDNADAGESSSNDADSAQSQSHESSEDSSSTAPTSDASTSGWYGMSIYLKAAIAIFASLFFAGVLLSIRSFLSKKYRYPDGLPVYAAPGAAPMHNNQDAGIEDSRLAAGETGGEVNMITRNHLHENSDTSGMLNSSSPASQGASAAGGKARLNRGRNA